MKILFTSLLVFAALFATPGNDLEALKIRFDGINVGFFAPAPRCDYYECETYYEPPVVHYYHTPHVTHVYEEPPRIIERRYYHDYHRPMRPYGYFGFGFNIR